MKISDFNKEELNQMKQACIDTRAKYDGYSDHQVPPRNFSRECPLCTFSHLFNCEDCPWSIFEGTGCVDGRYGDQPAMTRRKRIDRWIKLIDEEIRRRG